MSSSWSCHLFRAFQHRSIGSQLHFQVQNICQHCKHYKMKKRSRLLLNFSLQRSHHTINNRLCRTYRWDSQYSLLLRCQLDIYLLRNLCKLIRLYLSTSQLHKCNWSSRQAKSYQQHIGRNCSVQHLPDDYLQHTGRNCSVQHLPDDYLQHTGCNCSVLCLTDNYLLHIGRNWSVLRLLDIHLRHTGCNCSVLRLPDVYLLRNLCKLIRLYLSTSLLRKCNWSSRQSKSYQQHIDRNWSVLYLPDKCLQRNLCKLRGLRRSTSLLRNL